MPASTATVSPRGRGRQLSASSCGHPRRTGRGVDQAQVDRRRQPPRPSGRGGTGDDLVGDQLLGGVAAGGLVEPRRVGPPQPEVLEVAPPDGRRHRHPDLLAGRHGHADRPAVDAGAEGVPRLDDEPQRLEPRPVAGERHDDRLERPRLDHDVRRAGVVEHQRDAVGVRVGEVGQDEVVGLVDDVLALAQRGVAVRGDRLERHGGGRVGVGPRGQHHVRLRPGGVRVVEARDHLVQQRPALRQRHRVGDALPVGVGRPDGEVQPPRGLRVQLGGLGRARRAGRTRSPRPVTPAAVRCEPRVATAAPPSSAGCGRRASAGAPAPSAGRAGAPSRRPAAGAPSRPVPRPPRGPRRGPGAGAGPATARCRAARRRSRRRPGRSSAAAGVVASARRRAPSAMRLATNPSTASSPVRSQSGSAARLARGRVRRGAGGASSRPGAHPSRSPPAAPAGSVARTWSRTALSSPAASRRRIRLGSSRSRCSRAAASASGLGGSPGPGSAGWTTVPPARSTPEQPERVRHAPAQPRQRRRPDPGADVDAGGGLVVGLGDHLLGSRPGRGRWSARVGERTGSTRPSRRRPRGGSRGWRPSRVPGSAR